MEGAGKLIDDEALREAMAERGLGTPATRAATIEGLIAQKYLARDGRELHVTGSGMRLIELVREMDIEGLYSPRLTGDWEYKLRQMEHGQLRREAFMKEIISYTNEIVTKARQRADELKNQPFPDLKVPCPMCGAESLKQTDATYECREPDCKFKAKKHIAGRLLTEDEARQLFTTKHVGPLTGFKSKFNKPFDAALELDDKFKINFVFDNDDKDAVTELTEEQLIGEVDTRRRPPREGLSERKGLSHSRTSSPRRTRTASASARPSSSTRSPPTRRSNSSPPARPTSSRASSPTAPSASSTPTSPSTPRTARSASTSRPAPPKKPPREEPRSPRSEPLWTACQADPSLAY